MEDSDVCFAGSKMEPKYGVYLNTPSEENVSKISSQKMSRGVIAGGIIHRMLVDIRWLLSFSRWADVRMSGLVLVDFPADPFE